MRRTLLSALSAAVLAGCSMAPDYHRPAAPVPAAWPSGAAYKASEDMAVSVADVTWQEFFGDPKLKKILELALENNRDLRIAALNIDKARAQYRVREADLFPEIDASAGANISRAGARNTATGKAETTKLYSASIGTVSWELDLFGRIASLEDQALEQYLSTEEARRSAQISLLSETASAYLTLAADRERLALAESTLKSQEESLNLTKRVFDLGMTSELDVHQAQTSVDSARVDIARYTAQSAKDLNALRLLAGTDIPDDLLPMPGVSEVSAFKDIPAGMPSDILLRRPDVLSAEHLLKGANANIGAARAAFFPKITLTATSGSTSDALKILFKAGTGGWAFAPDIILPIFDFGSNQANLDAAKADSAIQTATYEKAIQTAFREVADGLADQGTLGSQLDAQSSLVSATEKSYRLSDSRYRKGVSSYLDVLDAQRSLYKAQQDLISVRLSQQQNLVTMYKVLGGGWK